MTDVDLLRLAAQGHKPLTTPGQMGVVADNEKNAANDFWKAYIGHKVALLKIGPDGLYDVLIVSEGAPCFGVSCERFWLYEEPAKTAWYQRLMFWRKA